MVSSTHSYVEWLKQLLWIVFVFGIAAEACSEATLGRNRRSSGKGDRTSADTEAIDSSDTEATRLAAARLQADIQNLSVAKGKVAPLVAVSGHDLKVIVDVNVTVASVLNINDARQTMTSSAFIIVSWNDKALSWNTSEYNGVEWVDVSADSIWTPDVYIANSLDKKSLLADALTVTVYANGTVLTIVDRILETMCDMDLQKYPYDTQNCPLVFVHAHLPTIAELHVYIFLFDQLSRYLSYSSEWDLVSQRVESVCLSGDTISSVSLEVRRQTTFYTVCLVLPLVLTSFMNTLVFLVPLQSGEKVSFLVSIFVSTSVFVTFFKDVMPRGLDSVPATMKLLIGVILESLLVLLATLFVMTRGRGPQEAGDEVLTSAARPRFQAQRGGGGSDDRSSSTAANPAGLFVQGKESAQRWKAADSKVSPVVSEDAPSFPTQAEGNNAPSRWWRQMSTQRLDRLLFLLSFFANIVFLASLFVDSF